MKKRKNVIFTIQSGAGLKLISMVQNETTKP